MAVRMLIALVVTLMALAVSGPAGATFAGKNGQLAFSNDGVIYLAGTRGADAVRVVPRATDGTVLDNDTLRAGYPAWSPDGTRIAFRGSRKENDVYNSDVYVMNADGSGLERLTYAPSRDWMPTWSPDGSMIAFLSDRKLKHRSDLYVMQTDGTDVRPLAEPGADDPGAGAYDPVWSPDGSAISYLKRPSGSRYMVTLDGSTPPLVPLVSHALDVSAPILIPALSRARDLDWSPDGSRVAYTTYVPGQGWHLFTARLDGSDVRPLTRTPRPPTEDRPGERDELAPRTLAAAPPPAANHDPTWSPDGHSIAFGTGADIVGEKKGIYVMNTDGTDVRQIVASTGLVHLQGLSWQSLPPDTPGTPGQPTDNPNTTDGGQPTAEPRNAKGCTITGTSGDDVLVGTPGRDVICGLAGDDTIRGLAGNDVIKAGAGDDIVKGGAGKDRIRGQAGADQLFGHKGADIIRAGTGDDKLVGGAGRDKLFGQAGDDTFLIKKGGRDTAKGGPGQDEARYDKALDRIRSIEASF